jgi:protein-tyrosine-phosphatase
MTGRLSEAAQGLLAREPRFAGLPAIEQAAYADLILAMCGGAVRVAMRQWAQASPRSVDDDLEQRATSLVKEMVGKLR